MANIFDRAGHSCATSGTGTLTLGSVLGAVAPNLCSFETFANAGVQDQNIVSYLILDSNGAWETGWGIYTASGTTLTRNVTKSSNSNAAISLSGNEQVFVTMRAEDMATVEALAAANIVINGGMDVSQFNGANSVSLVSGANTYIVDQWVASFTSASLVMASQQVAPPGSPPFVGLQNCLQLKATTGAALGTGDTAYLAAFIEGRRVARLGFGAAGASAVTVGFWVYATIAGTMTINYRNDIASRSYLTNVTINNANTWQWVTVTIPGDVTGAWQTTSALAHIVLFCFGAGATLQGTNNAWQAANVVGTSLTTNFFATTNNLVAITGAVLLPGAHQISQEQAPLLMRPFDTELRLSERYYEKSYDYASLPGAVSTNGAAYNLLSNLPSNSHAGAIRCSFASRKRAAPTMTFYSPVTGTSGKAADLTAAADVTASALGTGETGSYCTATSGAAQTTYSVNVQWVADARL